MHTWKRVAQLTRTKNLSGGLLVRSAEGLPFLLTEGMQVSFVPPRLDAPRTGKVTQTQPNGGDTYLVFFDTIDDIGTAEAIAGSWCLGREDLLNQDILNTLEESLVGYEVIDTTFGALGQVGAVIDNPAQSLLSVKLSEEAAKSLLEESSELCAPRTEPVLIPYVDAFVLELNHDEKTIAVSIPRDLLYL